MNDQNNELLKLKAITTAREILNTEYAARRTEEYNAWTTNSQNAWRNGNTFSPFPPYFSNPALTPFQSKISYPTEAEVVNKALELYNQAIAPPPAPIAAPATRSSPGIMPTTTIAPSSLASEPITVFGDISPAPASENIQTEPEIIEEPVFEPVVEIVEELEPEPAVQETKEPEPVVEIAEELEPEPVVEEIAHVEPEIIEEPAAVEEIVPEEVVIETNPYVAGIKDIYKDVGTVPAEPKVTWPPAEIDLSPQPMPADQLVKASQEAEKLLPSVLRKIEELKLSWSSKK